MKTTNNTLPKPTIVEGIMELIRSNKDKISLKLANMNIEERLKFYNNSRINRLTD